MKMGIESMRYEPKTPKLTDAIPKMCGEIVILGRGSLARLRRMDLSGPGEPEFWKLVVSHQFRKDQYGMILIKLFAILTPKGQSGGIRLHAPDIPLGKLLANSKSGRPLLSETRFLRFIALPFDKRPEALERICRQIAANGHNGVDCRELANLLFFNDVKQTRKLARFYFSEIYDRSQFSTENSSN